jgi:hypothetical protein
VSCSRMLHEILSEDPRHGAQPVNVCAVFEPVLEGSALVTRCCKDAVSAYAAIVSCFRYCSKFSSSSLPRE